MAASFEEEAKRFAIVSVPYKTECFLSSKRVIGTYHSRAEAHRARETLIAHIAEPSGYIEEDDYYWVSYGNGPEAEVLLLIEAVEV